MKKILFTLLICLFLMPSVNAELKYDAQRMKLLNRQYSDFPFTTWYSVGEETTYEGSNYVEFDATNSNITTPNDLPKYVYSIFCSTSDLNLYTIDSVKGSMSNTGTVSGGNCQVIHNGNYYNGKYYLNRWLVNQWAYYTGDLGQVYGVKWSIRVRNNTSSNIYIRFESMFVSNEMITDFKSDVLLSQLIEQNSSLKTQLNEIETSTNETNTKLDETNKELNDVNDNLTNSDINDSTGSDFFEGFESDDYGLSDIITMPLDLIKGLTSNTCVALNLTIPFVNQSFQLPCMSTIYRQYFGEFFSLYQTITFGFVAYWVIVKIFALVKGFKDPDDDKVEVLDL